MLKGPVRNVCFECHDDFLSDAKYKHAPAEEGECLALGELEDILAVFPGFLPPPESEFQSIVAGNLKVH